MAQRPSRPVADAVAAATHLADPRRGVRAGRRGRPSDVFGGELRRRDLFPLLILHFASREPAYGNRLIEEIEAMTGGVVSVNPNTMYPLLREMEANGLLEGRWEHPEKRTRRFYEITDAGAAEYARLRTELEPFLETMIGAITLIKAEIYGAAEWAVSRRPSRCRRRWPTSGSC